MREIFNLDNEQIIQQYLIKPVEQYLDLEHWGFKLSYASYQGGYKVVYDSSRCRLSCTLSFDPRDEDNTIGFCYGRLHAPDEEMYMEYMGEKCDAWHGIAISYIGHFLDGMPPRELGQLENKRIWIPYQARKSFDESEVSKGLRNPKWNLILNQFIWDYYNERLFELFDLQQTERWEKYRLFLRELYDELQKNPMRKMQLDNKPEWKPHPWQVC